MFVHELGQDGGGDEIVSAVISLAHALGLEVVAEGVETERQLEILPCPRLRLRPGLPLLAAGAGQRTPFAVRAPADTLRSCARAGVGTGDGGTAGAGRTATGLSVTPVVACGTGRGARI